MIKKIILTGEGILETKFIDRFGVAIKEHSVKVGEIDLIEAICEKLEYNQDQTIPNRKLGNLEIMIKQNSVE